MTDRDERLRQLTDELQSRDAVVDAFLAKSFTDRLLIVDVCDGDSVPEDLSERLAEYDLYGADEVYENGDGRSFVGTVGDASRYHFVDVRTRGSHQSYIVD